MVGIGSPVVASWLSSHTTALPGESHRHAERGRRREDAVSNGPALVAPHRRRPVTGRRRLLPQANRIAVSVMPAMSKVVAPLPAQLSDTEPGASRDATLTGLPAVVSPGSTWAPAAPV